MTRDAGGDYLLSNSEVGTFLRCRRKWWLEWYRGLHPATDELVGPRPTGTRIHEALAGYYVPADQTPTPPMVTLLASQDRDLAALQAQHIGPEETGPPAGVMDAWAKTIDLEKAMISGYVDWLAETGGDEDLEITAPEVALDVPFEAPGSPWPVRLIGRLDVRGALRHSGLRVFLDHKTTDAFTRITNTAQQDRQMLHYMVLERHADEQEHPRTVGALYNILRKVKRTAQAKPPFYLRHPVEHNVIEVDNYERKLRAVLRDITNAHAQLDAGHDHMDVVYPNPTSDCSWQCDSFTICKLLDDGSRAEDAIAALFVVQDPLRRYQDDNRAD